jgi:hypothetical protein
MKMMVITVATTNRKSTHMSLLLVDVVEDGVDDGKQGDCDEEGEDKIEDYSHEIIPPS